jgi:linoleoyl-CoA desaturase
MTGRSPRDCPQLYVKASLLLIWLLGSYALLVFAASAWWAAIPLAISLGLAMAAVGFCVQHDGGHKAFSKYRWVNKLTAMTMDLLGASSYLWDHKHNTIHHTYANIANHDDDIDVGWMGRLAPEQRRLWFHRVQHYYLWLLYGFLPIKWQLWDDFHVVARGRIGPYRFRRPRSTNLLVFIGGKVLFLSLAFGIPLVLHPWWQVGLLYAIASLVNGMVLSTVFQLAHVVEEAEFPTPETATGRIPNHWAVHQVRSTVNFARHNPVLTWFLGGLNYQIEHHLFPRICHIHYPRISRLVESACKRHGLPYNEHRHVFAAVASHFRWLRQMGRPLDFPAPSA